MDCRRPEGPPPSNSVSPPVPSSRVFAPVRDLSAYCSAWRLHTSQRCRNIPRTTFPVPFTFYSREFLCAPFRPPFRSFKHHTNKTFFELPIGVSPHMDLFSRRKIVLSLGRRPLFCSMSLPFPPISILLHPKLLCFYLLLLSVFCSKRIIPKSLPSWPPYRPAALYHWPLSARRVLLPTKG